MVVVLVSGVAVLLAAHPRVSPSPRQPPPRAASRHQHQLLIFCKQRAWAGLAGLGWAGLGWLGWAGWAGLGNARLPGALVTRLAVVTR